ncbi:hypothetical protein BEWA_049000 [Theileria equi strain WA]|uniref:Uncharacterized protein n=1 Tax=Theileria equi strain WA TaxID=1537102 RepID=L1LB97_THEEQ|nr:hypothetical protein BEWA_049000 [Theileria equi strain WA]EKX72433.1 hypothetical protein BEWA_049000 [Theileria equi strain WA]|eukprot:XP_004831885.1 hypothetical protein BEWA_049000 [Theileria equi strain WA]
MSKVNLDIHPEKYQSPGNGIKGTEKDFLGKYTTYYYTNGAEKFTLTGLSYKNTRFSTVVLTPITDVKNVVTYFENGNKKLLIIYIKTTTKHFYYTNNNAISNTNSNTEFADFVTKDGRALGEDPELKEILQKIEDDKKLYYNDLSVELKDKLWRSSSVIFDLRKIPKQSYNSEVTDENITISEPTEIDNTYSRVEHGMASEPFYIKGVTLPNSESMTLDGGFPNDPLGKFYIYQKTDDYTNPLLVTLKVNVSGNVERYINSYYYLSKNSNNSDKWDISRVAGVDIGDSDIKAILDNIVDYNKLDVSGLPPTVSGKLKDLTKDLIIDLTKTIDTSVGNTKEYYSEGVHIPYIKEKIQVQSYSVIRHAHTFPSFTVKSIKTGSGDITEKQLPPYGTLLGGLNVYCKDNLYSDPVLIELFCLDTSGNEKYQSSTTLLFPRQKRTNGQDMLSVQLIC